jgi:hypothetical protein
LICAPLMTELRRSAPSRPRWPPGGPLAHRSRSVARGPGGEDARHRRVQFQRFGAQVSETCLRQQGAQPVGGLSRRCCGGAPAAGLRHQGDSATAPQQPADVAQLGSGLGPQADVVDCKCGVERSVGDLQVLDRRVDEADPPCLIAAALRRRACRIITSEWSTPTTSPRVARPARAATATPGPQPSSRT